MKKILALLMAAAMVFAFAACGGNDEEETTTNPEITTEAPVNAEGEEVTDGEEEATEEEEEATEVVTGEDGEAVTDKDGDVVTEKVTKEEKTEKEEKPSKDETKKPTQSASKKPSSKAEIVEYFNTSVNKVKASAKSLKQNYVTNYLAGTPTLVSGIKTVYNLIGGDEWLDKTLKDNSTGAATYTGADIDAKFPVEGESWASKLTAADVKNATCTEANGVYTITITTYGDAKSANVKHGQGHNPKAFNVPLPATINENIPGPAVSLVGTASMAYPESTIKITVDAATGNVKTADYDLKWTINFDKMGIVLPLGCKSSFVVTW